MDPEDIIEAFRAGGVELAATPDSGLYWSPPRYPVSSDGTVNKTAVVELQRQEGDVIRLLAERGINVDPAELDSNAEDEDLETRLARSGTVWPPITMLTTLRLATEGRARSVTLHPTETEALVAHLLATIRGRLVHLYWVDREDSLELLAVYELPFQLGVEEIGAVIQRDGLFVVESTTRLHTAEGIRIGLAMTDQQGEAGE